MGKGKTQTEAISKVVELSRENDKLNKLVEIFASWQKNLELNSDVNDEEVRELIMSLSPAYLKQREEWKQEGIEEGRQTRRTTRRTAFDGREFVSGAFW